MDRFGDSRQSATNAAFPCSAEGRRSVDRALRLLGCVERISALRVVAWLQIVGVETQSIIHHVLHAAPIAVLALWPRSPRLRHTAALTGIAWVLMLCLFTPMIRFVLERGIWLSPGLAFTWLAPALVVLCAVWATLNLATLARAPGSWLLFSFGLLVLAVVFAMGQSFAGDAVTAPTDGLIRDD